jgi:hypothetical protein
MLACLLPKWRLEAVNIGTVSILSPESERFLGLA